MDPLFDTILFLFNCSSLIHYIHSAVFLPPFLQVPTSFSLSSPPCQLLLLFPLGNGGEEQASQGYPSCML